MSDDLHYLGVEQLALLLGITPATVRNRLSLGAPMPPVHRPPGCRRILFKFVEVETWIEGGVNASKPAQRRGRPSKAEQVAASRAGRRP